MSDKDKKPDPTTLGKARQTAKRAIDKALDAAARPAGEAQQRAASIEHARAQAAIDAELGAAKAPHVPTPPLSGIGHSPTARPPESAPPTPPQEPFGMLDLEEPPERYGVDEVTVLARDPHTLFAYWEVTPEGRAAARANLGSDGQLVLRIYAVTIRPEGGLSTDTYDHHLDWDHGRRYFGAPRPGAHISAAVGLRGPDGRFAPIAQAPRIRVPFAEPGPAGPVEWMEVSPARSRGERVEPPQVVGGVAHAEVIPLPDTAVQPILETGWVGGSERVARGPGPGVPGAPGGPGAPGPMGSASLPTSPWRWRR
jgi:hypothetical protein